MAASDFLLSVGVKFNARDIDTKAIKDAITKSIASTQIEITKFKIGPEARKKLQEAILGTQFRMNNIVLGRGGITALKGQIKNTPFSISQVQFTTQALNSLNKQLKATPFQIATVQPAQQKAVGGGAQDVATQKATNAINANSKAQLNQRAEFLQTTGKLQELVNTTTVAERSTLNYLTTLKQGSTSLKGFGANIVKITQRFAAYLVSIKAILLVQQAFSSSLDVILKFDSALQNLAKIVDATKISLTDLGKELFNVANVTGNSFQAVADSTGEFVRQGLTIAEALDRAKVALIGVNAANISVSDSTKLITVALRVFGDEVGTGINALDILNATADNAATNQNQIVQALLRSGSAAKTVGISFGQLNAIIAATVEQTQLGGNQIGSALKTIFARLATNTGGFREQANALGANIQPGESLFSTLQKLAEVFPKLNTEQQAQLVELAAGKKRFTEFSAVLSQFGVNADGVSRVQELLNEQLNGTGNTAAKNAKELAKLSTKAQQTANAFSEFVTVLSSVGEDGGIAGGIGSILDSLTDFGKGLTGAVRLAKSLGNEFGSVFTLFQNIVKAGFFTLAPVVIKGLITGAKTFLGIGQNISSVVKNIANQQLALNAQIGVAESKAILEAKAHTLTTTELREQLKLRAQINQIQGQSLRGRLPSSTGGGVNPADPVSSPEGRFRGFFQSVDQLKSKGVAGIKGAVGKIQNTLSSFGGRLVATTLAFQALDSARPAIDSFVEGLRKSGDSYAADLVKSGQSSVEFGLQIALLGGPIAGIVTALTTFAFGTGQAIAKDIERTDAAVKSLNALGAFNVALGEVEKTGSRDLIEAFQQLSAAAKSDDPEERARALVGANQFVVSSLSALADQSSVLNTAFRQSGDVLTEATNQVAQALRAAKLDKVVQEAVSEIQKQATERQQQGTSGGEAAFSRLRDINAEIAKVVSGSTDELLTQDQVIAKITRQALARSILEKTITDQAKLGVLAQEDLLQSTGAIDAVTKNLLNEREKLKTTLSAQLDLIQQELDAAGIAVDLTKIKNNAQKSSLELAKGLKETLFDINKELETTNQNEQKRVELQKVIEGGTNNIAKANEELEKINQAIRESAKGQVDELNKSVALIRTSAVEAQNTIGSFENQLAILRKQNVERAKSAQTTSELLKQQLNVNTFSEQEALIKAKNNQKSQEAIKLAEEKLNQDLANLEVLKAIAQAAGENSTVQQLEIAIQRAKQLRDEQSKEIRQQFSIQLKTEIEQDAAQAFQKAEQSLRDFRINQIEEVLRKEENAGERRIALIEKLGETARGEKFIQTSKLKGDNQDERDFGIVTAALLRAFEEQGFRAIDGLNSKLDQLRVNGVGTFEELRSLKEKERKINQEISQLTSSGLNTDKLAASRRELLNIEEAIGQLTNRGIDNTRELEQVSSALGQARIVQEENIARRREASLDKVSQAAEKLNTSEKALTDARSQVPASNQAIIQGQKNLAQAESQVLEATKNLSNANQGLADANFQLALNIGLAEFKAKSAAGGFNSIQQAIGTLQTAFQTAVTESKGSFEAILNARREVLQEEVSLVQNQLQALRGLSQRAFTADPEQLAKLQEATQIAANVQSGQIGSQDLLNLSPEVRQALSGLTSAFPGLQKAIDEVGASLLGFDPNAFSTLEQQLLVLQTGIAETGKLGVDKAEEQVGAAKEQLEETRAQKELAIQQLANTILQKEALLLAVSETAQNVAVSRSGFRESVNRATQIISQLRRGTDVGLKISANIEQLETKQVEIVSELQNIASIINKLGTASATPVTSNARGSLTSSELNGVINAARLEKRAMPGGARLMLANTSETVLTKKQSRTFGFGSRPLSHAAGGNSVVDGAAFGEIATQLGNLGNQLQTISARAAQPQQIHVNLDSSRTIQVEGISDLQTSLQEIVTQRLGSTPSQSEIDTINQTVTDIVLRMKEGGFESFS